MNILKNLDTIGFSMNFYHDSDIKFRTSCGGCISILFIMFYTILFLILAEEDFYKLKPKSFFQEKPVNEDFKINLSDHSFLAGVEISSLNKIIKDKDKYFKPIFTYNKFIQDGLFKKIVPLSLNTTTCDKIKFKKKLNEHIFNLSNYYCPDLSTINDTIDGNFNSETLKYLRVEVRNCDYNGQNCGDANEIHKLFQTHQMIISIIYLESIYDMNDYEEPLKLRINSHLNIINPKEYLMQEMYYGSYTVIDHTTNNLISSKRSIHHNVGIQSLKYVTTVRPTDYMGYNLPPPEFLNNLPITFYGLSFIKGETEKIYDRNYKTIVETLAQVNGIATLVFAIVQQIVFKVSRFVFMRHMFYENVIIEEDPEHLKDVELLRSKATQIFGIKNSEFRYNRKKSIVEHISKKKIIPKNLIRKNIPNSNSINKNPKDDYLDSVEEDEINFSIRNNIIFHKTEKNNEKKLESLNKSEKEKIEKILERELKKYKNKSKQLKISYYEYLCSCIPKKNKSKNYSLFEIFTQKTQKQFDVLTYLQTNHKIKIIKSLLFNPNQRDLISLLSKKLHRIIPDDEGNLDFKKLNKVKKNLNDFVEYLLEENELNSFDRDILIRMFNFHS